MERVPSTDVLARSALAPAVELIRAVWQRKMHVVLGTFVCAAVAAVASLVMPPTYESRATLLVSPPPFKEAKDKEDRTIGLFPRLLDVQDYAILLKSDAVLVKAFETVRQSGQIPKEDLEDKGKPSRLQEAMTILTTATAKTAYGSEYSPALGLTVRASSPKLAQALAQAWAETAEDESVEYYRKSQGQQVPFLETQLAAVQSELEKVLELQEKNEAQFDPVVAQTRLDTLTRNLSSAEQLHIQAKADFEGYREETQALVDRMAGEKPTLTLFKSPPMEAVFLNPDLRESASSGSEEQIGFRSDELNPSYTEIIMALAQKEPLWKGNEQRVTSYEESMGEIDQTLSQEREHFAVLNRDYKRLQKQEEVLTRNYQELADRLQQAKIAEVEQRELGDIKVVAEAVLPDEKVAPQRKLIVLTAAVLGAFACTAFVLFRALLDYAGKVSD